MVEAIIISVIALALIGLVLYKSRKKKKFVPSYRKGGGGATSENGSPKEHKD